MQRETHQDPPRKPDELVVTLRRSELAEMIRAELESVQTEPPPEILDRRGAAALLGISLGQLDRLTRSGQIPCGRVGDSPRYLRSDLIAAVRGAK